jgi:hypothetical protein
VKIIDLRKRALVSASGESVLGYKDTGGHACYMIYGRLSPGEKGRLFNPGKGHEEIVLAVKGDLNVTGFFEGKLPEGSAFHLAGENECYLENMGETDAVYVISGGHSGDSHH